MSLLRSCLAPGFVGVVGQFGFLTYSSRKRRVMAQSSVTKQKIQLTHHLRCCFFDIHGPFILSPLTRGSRGSIKASAHGSAEGPFRFCAPHVQIFKEATHVKSCPR